MIRKIKIGVIGTANIAMRSVIPAIKLSPEYYELIGVASRGKANKFLAEQIEFFKGYDNLLNMKSLDAVYIPLPNALHYMWVKKALYKGLHVLVEKSLACSYKEVIELNKIAKAKNLALVENFQFRFHSQLEYIKSLLKENILGEIRIFRSSFCFPPFDDANKIQYKKELGGGALLDAGAYPLKLSQIILGNDLRVTSSVLNYDHNLGIDIWGGAFLIHSNGNLFSQIGFGFDNYYQCNIEIIGSKGKLYTNRIFTAPEGLEPTLFLETNTYGIEEINLDADNHFKKMLIHFYQCISGEADKNQEYIDNVNQARLMHELRNSSKN